MGLPLYRKVTFIELYLGNHWPCAGVFLVINAIDIDARRRFDWQGRRETGAPKQGKGQFLQKKFPN